MRLGCIGCLALVISLAGLLVAGIGGLLLSSAIYAIPERTAPPGYTVLDGLSGQQKLAEILLREQGLSRVKSPIVISQRELNGFLAHHLEKSDRIPLNPLIVQLTPGILEIQGRTSLGRLFAGLPFSLLVDYLPPSYVAQPVWVTVRGPIKHDRSRGSLEVLDFSLGTQSISPGLLSWMLGRKGQRLFNWRMPRSVERIVIEDGRVVVTTRQ